MLQVLLERFLDLLFAQLNADERRAVLKPLERDEGGRLDADHLTRRLLEEEPADEKRFHTIYNFARALLGEGPLQETDPQLAHFRHFMASMQEFFGGLYKKPFTEDTRKKQVEMFYASLPKVRRALANVPTYMMFDDHEVTDDWYPNPLWRDRVLTAPLPVLGPPVFDEIIAPLAYRMFDLVGYMQDNRDVRSGMLGTNPDAIEAWAFDPLALEALLKRLAPYRRVVLLSGDVHYGASQGMRYWTKSDTEPTRMAQFTSSGLRNVMRR